ncbi:hypothetical protein T4B_13365 [Trichinella pseudospiralis]|uniref:Uncharacterized protein n=1 Tax=Trichinella pseudospiralis TaxID=6337 RepID=A0A0V1GKN9_TRIPS|nr:hypothetical protein T4B_13365 [Trichinella pseudospiralis]
MSSLSCNHFSRSNHSVLAFTAFNSCGTSILATVQTFWFYIYGATIFWLADLTIPSSPSQHSTTVSVGYWLPGKPFGSTYTVLPSSEHEILNILRTPTSAKTLRRLFVHIENDPSAWPFSAEQILDLRLFIQPAHKIFQCA